MDSRLYETKLANHKIFKDLKDGLKEDPSGKLRNLLVLKDDVLYVWSPKENCLLCLNLTRLEETEDTPYQKLHLVTPPAFTVERIISSVCGSRLCVWGSRGVTVVELPTRWGRGGLFESGSETVLCKSATLDERFLYSQGEVRRVHWHPEYLSRLLVLVSDNTIRVYNIALKTGPKVVKIFSIGPKPTGQLAGRTLLDSLGDTAVDFTPAPDESLLILRGNGDVYMTSADLEGTSSPAKLSGPLAMYPPADDNYGTDSCSIAVLGGADAPPLVVVATCSASLYHCLLLPNSTDKEADGDTHALYVVEAVELSLALAEDADVQSAYPVHLYACTNNAYACVHAGGVHTVSLPLLGHLKEFALADDADTETVLSAMCSKPSVARHLVCTHGVAASFSPPTGVCLTVPPLPSLLVLCTDCTLIVRCLEPYNLEEQLYKEMQLQNPALEQDEIDTILKERQKLSFTAIVQEILSRDVSQPILNMNNTEEPALKETLELVTQATMRLRCEYMSRQQRVVDVFARKLPALSSLARQHRAWLGALQEEVNEVQLQSAVLKDKCMLAEKHQDDIKYRCSVAIRRLRASCATSPAERALLAELARHARAGERLAGQLAALKRHARDKSDELKKWEEEYKKKDIALGKSHSDTISSILQQQTKQISTLIEETKLLKDQLSIV